MADAGGKTRAGETLTLESVAPGSAVEAPQAMNRRERRFYNDILAYSRAFLAPRGLQVPDSFSGIRPPVTRRYTLVGETHVWKFYRPGIASMAANFQRAAELAGAADVAVPEIVFCDTSDEAVETFRLVCLVMKRVPGRPLTFPEVPQRAKSMADLMRRLHSVSSERRGPLVALEAGGRPKPKTFSWLEETEECLSHCETLARRLGIPPPEDLREPAVRLYEQLPPAAPPYQLLHGDFAYHNIIESGYGRLTLIDLDIARFDFFGEDLIRFIIRRDFLFESNIGDSPEEVLDHSERRLGSLFDNYFSMYGPDRYTIWQESRKPLLMLHGLRIYSQLLLWTSLRRQRGFADEFEKNLAKVEKVRAVMSLFATRDA